MTDDGLRNLARLSNLKSLRLICTGATGAGVAHLKAADHLERIDLGAATTDDGLKGLEGCTGLQMLSIYDNKKITDDGIAHLAGLHSLTFLWLVRTPITDAGLEHLKGLTSLDTLYLAGTKVTDKGLVHLQGMKDLRHLCLFETAVTAEGVATLKGPPKLEKVEYSSPPEK